MKRKYIYTVVCIVLLLGAAFYVYSKLNSQVVYAVTKEGWKEVYRCVDGGKAMNKSKYLQSHKEEGVSYYIFVDEEFGNSIIP